MEEPQKVEIEDSNRNIDSELQKQNTQSSNFEKQADLNVQTSTESTSEEEQSNKQDHENEEHKIKDLKSYSESLYEELQNKQTENQQLNAHKQELEKAQSELNNQLKEKNTTIEKFKIELQNQKAESQKQNRVVEKLKGLNVMQNNELKGMKEECVNQQQQIKNQNVQLEKFTTETNNHQKIIDKQKEELTQLNKKYKELNAQLKNSNDELAKLQTLYRKDKAELEQRLKQSQQNWIQLEKQLSQHDKNLKKQDEQIQTQSLKIFRLVNQKDTYEKKLMTQNTEFQQLEFEFTKQNQKQVELQNTELQLQDQVKKLEKFISEQNLKIDLHQSQVKEILNELNFVKVNDAKKQKDLEELQNKLSLNETELDKKTLKISQLEDENQNFTNQFKNSQIEIRQLKGSQIQKNQIQQNDKLNQENISYIRQDEALSLMTIQLKKEIASLKVEQKCLIHEKDILKNKNKKLEEENCDKIKIQLENEQLFKQLEELSTKTDKQLFENEEIIVKLNYEAQQKKLDLEDMKKLQNQNHQQYEIQIQCVQNKLLAAEDKILMLQSNVVQLQKVPLEMKNKIQKLEKENKFFNDQNEKLNNSIYQQDQMVSQLNDKVLILTEKSKNLEKKLQAKIDQLSTAKTEINKNIEAVNNKNCEIAVIINKLELYQKLCEDLKKQESYVLLQESEQNNSKLKAECSRLDQLPKFISKNLSPSKLYNVCLNFCRELLEYSVGVEQFTLKVSQVYETIEQLPIALLLGQNESSKQQLLQKLQMKQNIQLYEKKLIEHLENNIIDTDSFEFEDVDERERQIERYKNMFKKNPNKFNALWIIAKFERADIVKQSIMAIYKHVHKLKIPISLIVTDFHLSEDQEKDKEYLKKYLKIYKAKQIVFVGQNTNFEQLIQDLKQTLPETNLNQRYPLQFEDTLFEDENEEEQQRMMEQLQDQQQQ